MNPENNALELFDGYVDALSEEEQEQKQKQAQRRTGFSVDRYVDTLSKEERKRAQRQNGFSGYSDDSPTEN
jgi:hypothetical protein